MYIHARTYAGHGDGRNVIEKSRRVYKGGGNRWPHLRPAPCRARDAKDEGASGGRLFAVQGQASQAHRDDGCSVLLLRRQTSLQIVALMGLR
jgi:hypothetical protein